MKQASVGQLRRDEVGRQDGYVVVCMAFYPRGLKKDLMDEYRTHLAPEKSLFAEWKVAEGEVGHDEAFAKVDYEARFDLEPMAVESLRRLSDKVAKQDVYLVCQCEIGQRCHRELLLLYVREKFKTPIGPLHNEYPVFEARLKGK